MIDRHRRIAGALALAVLIASPLAAQSSGTLRGTVTDSASGTGVAEATVLVRGTMRGVQTDANGRYALAGLAPGSVTITVQRIGYASRSVQTTITSGRESTLDVILAPSAQVIAPLVVSATREMQRRTDASATIDVLSGEAVRDARAAHPAEIVNRLPGVHVSQLSGEGHSTAIRQPISTKPLYLYLEDGVPTRSTGFFNHNALYEVNLPQSGGMEVLKGPGTALYGSDAIGGVINVLTRPAPVSPSVDIATEAGAYGYKRLLATGGLTSHNQGIRVDLNATQADGFKDDAPYERYSATLRHDLWTSSNWTFRTVVTGTSVDQKDVLPLNGTNFEQRPSLNRSPIAFREVRALRWSTAAEYEKGTSSLSLTPFARHNVLDLIPNWQLTFNPEIWDTRNDSYGLLVKYRRDFEPLRTRLVVGVDAEYSPGDIANNGITSSRTGPDSIWSAYTVGDAHYDYEVSYRQASPYIHAEFSPTSRIRIDFGVRNDHSGYNYRTNLAPIQTGRFRVPEDTKRTFNRMSPKVGVTAELGAGINAYASYRQGFRAPAQGQLFQQGANANTVDLKPVVAHSTEVGVRGTAAGSRILYTIAAYNMRVENDILSILDANGVSTSSNAGETEHRGIEASLGAALRSDLRVDAAWSSAEHTYEEWVIPVSGANVSYAGKTMEQAPRTMGNVLLTYTPRLFNGGRVAAEWSHTGTYFMDADNTHKYGGFDIWTLHANYKLHNGAEVFGRVVNLLDEHYAELVSYNAFNREQYTPGNPRMVYAGIRWLWSR